MTLDINPMILKIKTLRIWHIIIQPNSNNSNHINKINILIYIRQY